MNQRDLTIPLAIDNAALAAETGRLRAEVQSKSEQIGNLYRVCNEKTILQNENERLKAALRPLAAIPLWSDERPDCRNDFIMGDWEINRLITVEQIKAAREALHDGRKPG